MLVPSRITDFLGLHFNLEKAIISPPALFLASLTKLLSRLMTTVMPLKGNFIHHQSHLAFRALYPSWTPAAQFFSVLDKVTLGPTQAILGHSITTECRIPISPALVQQTGCSPGSSSASTGTQPVLLHRCIPNRLESQLERSSPLRTEESSGLQSAHQLAGTRSHPISCSPVGTAMDQSDSLRLLRQQYSSSPYTQAGRDPFHFSVQQNSGTLSSSGPVWDSSHSNSPPWSQECYRRCPVSTQQSKSDRMAAFSGNLTQTVLCLRDSPPPPPPPPPPSGHVRHGGEPGDSNLHFTLPVRQSLGGRRPLHIMGRLRPSVRLPSSSHHPQDSPENQGFSQHHSDSDRLPAPVLSVAPTTTTTQPTSSHSADRRGSLPVRAQHATAPVPQGASPVRSSRVAIIRDILKQHDFSDSVVDMAADPLRDSSSHVYNSQWKAFDKWANDKGIQSKDLSHVTLAEYLVHLYAENKQFNTIKVHRAAIASELKMLNPPTALQEDTIHNIIRRLSILCRQTQEVLPQWHLSVVLKGLMKPPFAINGSDRNISLELLSYKMAFLLALATGARGSKLVALY